MKVDFDELSPNHLFGEYLEHSCRYYILNNPVISDSDYDKLCVRLLSVWDQVTHKYKQLTDESALSAGTGFQMEYTMPSQIVWLCRMVSPDKALREYFNKTMKDV